MRISLILARQRLRQDQAKDRCPARSLVQVVLARCPHRLFEQLGEIVVHHDNWPAIALFHCLRPYSPRVAASAPLLGAGCRCASSRQYCGHLCLERHEHRNAVVVGVNLELLSMAARINNDLLSFRLGQLDDALPAREACRRVAAPRPCESCSASSLASARSRSRSSADALRLPDLIGDGDAHLVNDVQKGLLVYHSSCSAADGSSCGRVPPVGQPTLGCRW